MNKENLEATIINVIETLGIPMGSRAWGCAKEDSDWDYAIEHPYTRTIQKLVYNLTKEMPEISEGSTTDYYSTDTGEFVLKMHIA